MWNGTAAVSTFGASGAAGGDLTGTYPNPTIANDAISSANISNTGIAVNRLLITDATTGANVTYKTCGLDETLKWTATGWACSTAAAFIGNTGVTAATYGNATQVSQVQVDAQGRIVTAANVSIDFPVVSVAGKTGAVTLNTADISGLGTAAVKAYGTAAGNLVELDGGGKIPASLLPSSTGDIGDVIAGSGLTGGGSSGAVTLAVDTGVTSGKIVAVGASDKLPAIDGSNLTQLNAVKLQTRDVAATAPTAAQVLTWNAGSSAWEPQALPAGNSGDITSVSASTGLTGGSASGDATLAIDVGTTTGKIVQMAASDKLPAVDGSNLTGITAAQVSGAFANNGNAFGAAGTLGTNDNFALNFETNGSTAMTISPTGFVGIGSVSPTGILDVQGGTALAAANGTNISIAAQAAGAGNQNGGNIILSPGAKTGSGLFGAVSVGGAPPAWFGANSNSLYVTNTIYSSVLSGNTATVTSYLVTPIHYGSTAVGGSLTLDSTSSVTKGDVYIAPSGGNVGIGTGSPQSLLHVNGVVRATDICDENGANCKDISGGWGGGGDIDGVYTATGLTGGFASGSGTLSVDVGTTTGQIVQVAASNKLPAMDGSNLTAVNAIALRSRQISVTAPTADQILAWNAGNSTWEPKTDAFVGTVTSVVGGAGLTGGNITSTGTLAVDVGVTAGKIVQMQASDKLPAVDGSDLTQINAVKLQTRNVAATAPTAAQVLTWNAGLSAWEPQALPAGNSGDITSVNAGTGLTGGSTSGDATLAIDVGTTTGKIVQMAASDKLPAVDGSNLTGITAAQISGTFANSGNSFGSAATLGTNDNFALNLEANGSTAMTILPSGNIGVGVSNPLARLDVVGDGITSARFQGGSLDNLAIAGDNFGFGTYVSNGTLASPTASVNGDFLGGMFAYGHNGTGYRFGGSIEFEQTAVVGTGVPAAINFRTYDTGTGNQERMRISSTGNVGIGTASPQSLLHVNGVVRATDICDENGANCKDISGGWGGGGDIDGVYTSTGLTGGFASGSGTLSVDVGTTTGQIVQMAASNKLPVVDGSNLVGITASQVSGAFANSGNTFGAAATLGTNDNFPMNFEANDATAMTILPSGFVGIGTTNPSVNLEVVSANSSYMELKNTASTVSDPKLMLTNYANGGSTNAQLDINNYGGTEAVPAALGTFKSIGKIHFNAYSGTALQTLGAINVGTANPAGRSYIQFSTSDGTSTGPKLHIDYRGYVAIGSTAPAATLDVYGTDALIVPRGTTAQRPGTPVNGMIRYNSTNSKMEIYEAGAWADMRSLGDIEGVYTSTGLTGGFASGSGTLSVDVGTTTGQIVQVAASNKLPAMDGSDLTSINAVQLQARNVAATAPTAAQVLTWNAGNSSWEPQTISAASGGGFVNSGNSFGAAATLGTNDNFALNFEANNSTAMTILPSGNVGIETTTPIVDFQVGNFSAAQKMLLGGPNANTASSEILFSDNPADADPYNAGMGIRFDSSNNRLSIDDNYNGGGAANNPRLVIERDTGYVGINTASPQRPIHIVGNNQVTLLLDDTSASVNARKKYLSSRSDNFYLGRFDDNMVGYQDQMTITNSGNVGIGTTVPGVTLHPVTSDAVTNTVTNVLKLGHDTSGIAAANYGTGILFAGESSTTANQDMAQISSLWTTATHASRASALTFSTLTGAGALTERVRIDGSGNVGIGTTTPQSPLHVNGIVRATDICDENGANCKDISGG